MPYRGFSGGGFVGNFLSTTLLEQLRPAADNAGRQATVGNPATRAAPYRSDGESWKAVALYDEATQSLVSGDKILVGKGSKLGTLGRRIFYGRPGTFDNTTSNTFHAVFEVPCDFDAARVILFNGTNSTYTVSTTCTFAVLDSAADLNGSALTWTDGTFPTGTVPAAASTTRRGFLKSEFVNISNSGKATRLLAVRVRPTTAGSITIMGNGSSDAFTNWATRTDGHLVCFRNEAGTFNANSVASGFTSTTNRSQSPICGIEVACRGRVLNLGVNGDSNDAGFGSTYIGSGYGLELADELAAEFSLPVFFSNLAWAGQTSGQINNQIVDAITYDLKPDLWFAPAGSTNDYTSDNITDADIATGRSFTARHAALVTPNKVGFVLRNSQPSNPAATGKNFDATDTKRVAWNAELAASYELSTVVVFDCSTPTSGAVDGGGQVVMAAGSTTDNVHFNDGGVALILPNALTSAKTALGMAAAP